jgi:hypothetical protein
VAELERLRCLSDVLAAYTLPDALSSAEIFQAQVILRLSRRPKRTRYASWPWYVIPLSLFCTLVGLCILLALPQALSWIANLAGWLGIDLTPLFSALVATRWGTALNNVFGPSTFRVLAIAWQALLYSLLVFVFVPYAGWVNVLWRSRTHSALLKGDHNGSL